MNDIRKIEARREAVLGQMRAIRSMKKGSVTRQYVPVPQQGKSTARRGPYYVFCQSRKGRTISRRLRSNEEFERAKADVAAHKRFVALCKQFVELTEKLGELEREASQAPPEKKRRRSPSSGTRK